MAAKELSERIGDLTPTDFERGTATCQFCQLSEVFEERTIHGRFNMPPTPGSVFSAATQIKFVQPK
jgi:hypothetical protein